MKRPLLVFMILLIGPSLAGSGFHFGMGRAAAKKSADLIDEAVQRRKNSQPGITAGISLSARTVIENSASGTIVGSLSSNDLSAAAFSLSNDAGGRFKIGGNTLQVADGSQIVYQNANSYSGRNLFSS